MNSKLANKSSDEIIEINKNLFESDFASSEDPRTNFKYNWKIISLMRNYFSEDEI